jgi:regulator of cell morphogenesis and NO signaling
MQTTQTPQTIAGLTADQPLAIRALERHGIEFCCGGSQPLQQACAEKGIDVAKLLEEVRQDESAAVPAPDWSSRPLSELIDHILEHYHKPLDTELPRLEALMRKVIEVHGPTHPELFAPVFHAFETLREQLDHHMQLEETALFPWIRAGQRMGKNEPLDSLRLEHESEGWLLQRLRLLTDDYRVPAEACPNWKALWQGLEALEQSLLEHTRLESQVLIPRSLQGK